MENSEKHHVQIEIDQHRARLTTIYATPTKYIYNTYSSRVYRAHDDTEVFKKHAHGGQKKTPQLRSGCRKLRQGI